MNLISMIILYGIAGFITAFFYWLRVCYCGNYGEGDDWLVAAVFFLWPLWVVMFTIWLIGWSLRELIEKIDDGLHITDKLREVKWK